MKSTIMFRLVMVAAPMLATLPLCSAQSTLAGDWQGTLDANGTTYHVAWHLQAGPDGSFISTIDNADENIYGIKAKSTQIDGSNIRFAVDEQVQANGEDLHLVGSFAGTVSANGKEVDGTWTQEEPEQSTSKVHFVHAPQAGSSASPAAAAEPSVAGDWAGTLSAGGAELRLVLHITAAADRTLSATLDSLDQGVNGIPVKSITFDAGKLNLDVEAVHGTYEGTVNEGHTEIAGTWSQGQPLTLNFKRAEHSTAATAPKPAAPTDIDGTWTGKLETGASTMTINLKIANMDTGLTAQIQSPDQAPNWAPANSITRDGDKLRVVFKAFNATYEGKISADHTTIDGKFSQKGNELPLVLRKS